LCTRVQGFSLHAARTVAADDRLGLERLCRYGLRAPFSLDALSVVSDPTVQVRQIERVTRRKTLPSGRSAKALNPLSREDAELFQAVMAGEHILRGFRNADLRHRLRDTGYLQLRQASYSQLLAMAA
jgi:hypothetical protein